MTRDCGCPRARHQHGTYLSYEVHRCRCFPCRLAWAAAKSRARVGGSYAVDPRYTTRAGTERRIQALLALGWRHCDITARLRAYGNAHASQTDQLLRRGGDLVWKETALAVARVYDELSMTVGPSDRTRSRAAKLGYLPPLAWDDDEIDNPNARPHTPTGSSSWDLHPCGTPAAARRHYRRREPLCDACRNAGRRQTNHRQKAA